MPKKDKVVELEKVHADPETVVALVNKYIQTYRTPKWHPDTVAIRKRLGWSMAKWKMFLEFYGDKLIWDKVEQPEEQPPQEPTPEETVTQVLAKTVTERGIDPKAVSQKMRINALALMKELRSIGLTTEEIKAAVAMRTFGENHFSDSMQMVSAGIFTTAQKLQTQQRVIESRLILARQAIDAYGPFRSDERDEWVKEEEDLVRQYSAIGRLLNEIQETWYKGAAQLALVEMRVRDQTPGFKEARRKPGFRPTIIDTESNTITTTVSPDEQVPDQVPNEVDAP